jgi:hypothetical protein
MCGLVLVGHHRRQGRPLKPCGMLTLCVKTGFEAANTASLRSIHKICEHRPNSPVETIGEEDRISFRNKRNHDHEGHIHP